MQWTIEQNNAITIPVADTIVSAAAGSGKTAVMAERIIRRLTGENYVDIDKILVVTYTRAAASEIKERVMQKIVEKLASGENPALSKQLVMLNNSHFCTIHSFCLDLIRKYFHKLGIDPGFAIADETEVKLLKTAALDEVMNEYYNKNDGVFLELVASYSQKSDKAVVEMISSVYEFSKTMPDSEAWLDSLCTFYDGKNSRVCDFLCERAYSAAKYACKFYEEGIEICSQNENCTGWYNLMSGELEAVRAAINEKSYSKMYEAFSGIEFRRWSSPKDVSPELKDLVKGKRDEAKSVIDKITSSLLFASPYQIENDGEKLGVVIRKIAELAKRTDEIFSSLKRERNIIDFSDFEHLALRLLVNEDGTPSEVAFQVSSSFEEIYIDEYQDCNNIQNKIFEFISGAIRGCPNVYCVGDMKQSIYRFRDANPMLFRHKCDTYPLYSDGCANPYNKILLNSNFRSRKSVLGFVNSVFSQIMSRTCGELEYEESEWLNYGGGYIDVNDDIEKIDIDIIDTSDSFDSLACVQNTTPMSAYEAEATHVANKIKKIVSGGYMLYDKKKQITRPAQYKDIVILMRSPSKTAPVFEQVLTSMGIPVYNEKSAGYFDTEEIVFLISLLKIIDNPDDDISLVTVMKNTVFSFDENELLKLRMDCYNRKASFYSCIKNYISKNSDLLSKKCSGFLEMLGNWYDKSRYMDTDSFIGYLINEIDYFSYLSLFPDSTMKKANVRYLLCKAKEFESTNFKGIFSFVRYVENTKSVSAAETAKVLSENDDVVRIMSIHHSKGLEYPVVFLSCLGRKLNKMDARGTYVLHKDFGIGIDSVYREKAYKLQTVNRIAIKEKINLDILSEELRVLYVALTRPTEKLILTGCLSNGPKELNKLEFMLGGEGDKINPFIVEKCDSFMSLILLAVMRSEKCQLDFNRNRINLIEDGCEYNISLMNKCEITASEHREEKMFWEAAYNGKTGFYPVVCSQLEFEYPYGGACGVPGNVTVSELKRMAESEDGSYRLFDGYRLSEPEFLSETVELAGAQLGSLVHLVMEKLEFKNYASVQEVRDELEKLCDSGVISKREFDSVDSGRIYEFFNSDLGAMMTENKSTLVREFSFKYFMDASEVFDVAPGEKMIVQGAIDAYFEDKDGRIVVVDYKTDKVGDKSSDDIVEKYSVQIDHYAKALGFITGKEVKSKYLYLFDTGEAVEVK